MSASARRAAASASAHANGGCSAEAEIQYDPAPPEAGASLPMRTLLVLGSKPDPVLPSGDRFDALACANASGRSAQRHGLPTPLFTVISAIVTSGKQASNRLALEALAGLGTATVYFYPRPVRGRGPLGRGLNALRSFRTSAPYFKGRMRSLPYSFDRFENPGLERYHGMLAELCDHEPELVAQVRGKQPSSGMLALAIGIAWHDFERVVLSGFSFEITHAYADNPLIAERGSASSKHAVTDVALLRHLCRKSGTIYTTEPTVHERAGVPLLEDAPAERARRAG
jgi:hypothetical protein